MLVIKKQIKKKFNTPNEVVKRKSKPSATQCFYSLMKSAKVKYNKN